MDSIESNGPDSKEEHQVVRGPERPIESETIVRRVEPITTPLADRIRKIEEDRQTLMAVLYGAVCWKDGKLTDQQLRILVEVLARDFQPELSEKFSIEPAK